MMGLVLAFVALFGAGDITLGAPVLFAGLVYAMAYERGIFSRLLNTALFQALGRWSYSIYMVHYFLLICLTQGVKLAGKFLGFPVEARMVANGYGVESKVYVFADWWTVDMIQLGYLAAVIAMSAVTYRFIELPFQHAFARRAARKMP